MGAAAATPETMDLSISYLGSEPFLQAENALAEE